MSKSMIVMATPKPLSKDDGQRRPGVGEAGPRAVSRTGLPTVAVVKFAPRRAGAALMSAL